MVSDQLHKRRLWVHGVLADRVAGGPVDDLGLALPPGRRHPWFPQHRSVAAVGKPSGVLLDRLQACVQVMAGEPRTQPTLDLVMSHPTIRAQGLDLRSKGVQLRLVELQRTTPQGRQRSTCDRTERRVLLAGRGVHRAPQTCRPDHPHRIVGGGHCVVRRPGQPRRHAEEGRPSGLRLDRADPPDQLDDGGLASPANLRELPRKGRGGQLLPRPRPTRPRPTLGFHHQDRRRIGSQRLRMLRRT